ncbi:MAG: 4Fe-4S ferredoxin, iron-sulfur binding protein [Acidobacteria bacterium]|nr:4Fe-4S ferredoxin, iron-sulfur binding protein [Acidobacteriota bacterium]
MTPVQVVLDRAGIDRLIGALTARGYQVVGPTVRDGAIVYGDVMGTADLPVGFKDEQGPGTYRLTRREDEALFGYVVGPQSPKTSLHPAEVVVWKGERTRQGFAMASPAEPPRLAFLGVRPCELAAVAIQDRIFLGGARDAVYGGRRDGAFFVAVNCTEPGGTCFCASMGTGPRAQSGFDIALTEVLDGSAHYFVAVAGSEAGSSLLAEAGAAEAKKAQVKVADGLLEQAAGHMGREMQTRGLAEVLRQSLEDPHWQEVAKRCLTCANCTLVCPTCFCANVEDTTDLSGQHAERIRRWDSCFNYEFSLIHGGAHRATPAARYRQWMTHKLAWWFDQFGTSGCVGCGRCITWCPVGIDITAEAAAIRASSEEVA